MPSIIPVNRTLVKVLLRPSGFFHFGQAKVQQVKAPGTSQVGRNFAKIYWEDTGEQGRQRLGFATNEARDSQGAFQEFWNGRMFWAGEADTIYVIYRGYFDPDGDGQTTWMSYEDTFEDKKP